MPGVQELGEFIARRRDEMSPRLSQQALAEAAGVSKGMVSMLEAGHLTAPPKPNNLLKLAKGLKVSPAVIFEKAGIPIAQASDVENVRGAAVTATSDRIPFYGKVGCGKPIDLTGDPLDYLPMESFTVRDGQVVVQACGDSMDGAGIQDGDYLVIEPATTAPPGKIVIANLEGLGCTCKRLSVEPFKGGRVWWLNPESSNPEHTSHLLGPGDRIVGVVKGMYRSL